MNTAAGSFLDSCLRFCVTPEITDDPCASLIGVPAVDSHIWPGSDPIAYQTSPKSKRDDEGEDLDDEDEDWDDEDDEDWDEDEDEDWDDEDEDDEDADWDEDEEDEDWEDDEDWDDEED